jgi:hypothetical protein
MHTHRQTLPASARRRAHHIVISCYLLSLASFEEVRFAAWWAGATEKTVQYLPAWREASAASCMPKA